MADIRSELTCPICTEMYKDPVTLTCGHTYCQKCITRTWDNQDEREHSCPECRQRFIVRPDLKRNLTLCKITESLKDSAEPMTKIVGAPCTYCDSPVPAAKTCLHCEASLCEKHLTKHCKSEEHVLAEPTTSLENRKCSVHKMFLQYYCCEDFTYICVVCRLDEQHRGHQVENLTEASEKKKEKLRIILQKLTSEMEEAEKRVQSLQELKRQAQEKAAGIKGQVNPPIVDIRERLESLDKQVMSEIVKEERKVLLQASDQIQQLEIKKEDLSSKMGHIEKLCNMTDPLTVLLEQESGRVEYLDVKKGDNEDREKHHVETMDEARILETFKKGLSSIVNPQSRQQHLQCSSYGSDESGRLRQSQWSQPQQRAAQRLHFSHLSGIADLSSGKHCWEVESKSGDWCVGVGYPTCDKNIRRLAIPRYSKSWCLWKWTNKTYSADHAGIKTLLSHVSSCDRVGMILDCDAGRLSFYELCDPNKHIHTYTATFTEPVDVFFFSWGDSTFR